MRRCWLPAEQGVNSGNKLISYFGRGGREVSASLCSATLDAKFVTGLSHMNATVLKWLTSSIVGLVVCCAIWLAGSVKLPANATPYRLASAASPSQSLRSVERVPMPVDYAASAALQRDVALH